MVSAERVHIRSAGARPECLGKIGTARAEDIEDAGVALELSTLADAAGGC